MKGYLIAFVCLMLASSSANAQVIKPEDAAQLIGKTVTVCGEIFGGRFLETSKTSPTLLNMGAAYPKQPITIVIPIEVRRTFGFKPEEQLKNKHICVTGKVTKFQNTPQIVLTDKSQLKILQ